jgi:NAD(P)-dependent dehydrogenase (short-subunit alcohol dehydrogenase family)
MYAREMLEMGKLDGKVALITGAGSGIGRATAVLFAKEGAKVAVVDYVPRGGRETVRMIKKAGGEAVFIEADVSKAADVERMVKTTVNKYGRIDILHNNAGITGRIISMIEFTEDEWDSVLDTNLKGVFLGSKYAIPLMLDQGGGIIINTASTAGLLATRGMAAYSAAKAGLILLTKAMALEYGKQNIRVNCICAGGIQTPMTEPWMPAKTSREIVVPGQPLERMGQPEEVARAALYLACDDSSFVTGSTLVVDGGWSAGGPEVRPMVR